MERCKACGDPIDPDATREKLKKKGIQVRNNELLYCRECADELFRGKISIRPANLRTGGRAIHDSWEENASPWQEIAIRDMEEHDDAEPMQ